MKFNLLSVVGVISILFAIDAFDGEMQLKSVIITGATAYVFAAFSLTIGLALIFIPNIKKRELRESKETTQVERES